MSTSEMDAGRSAENDIRYAEQRVLDNEEPEAIERNIDATRADVQATLSALERKLSVDRLIELTLGRVRERGGEFAGNLTDAAARNPVPVVLASIGIGWLMLTSRSRNAMAAPAAGRARVARAADKVEAAASSISGQAHDAFESSRETLSGAADSVRASATRAADTTRETFEHAREQVDFARERMDHLLHEQPLLLGVFGLAAGALMGALLPTTEAEDRWLGDARETALKSAVRTGRERLEAVREHAAAYSPPSPPEDQSADRLSRPH
jgi:hypothetical protein